MQAFKLRLQLWNPNSFMMQTPESESSFSWSQKLQLTSLSFNLIQLSSLFFFSSKPRRFSFSLFNLWFWVFASSRFSSKSTKATSAVEPPNVQRSSERSRGIWSQDRRLHSWRWSASHRHCCHFGHFGPSGRRDCRSRRRGRCRCRCRRWKTRDAGRRGRFVFCEASAGVAATRCWSRSLNEGFDFDD